MALSNGDRISSQRLSDFAKKLWEKIKTTFVPTTRTINGKSLSSNVSLTGMDIPVVPGEAKATVYEYLQVTEQLGNKVTSWSSTTTDDNYPSEKLVKTALDGKANSSHTHSGDDITSKVSSATTADKSKMLMSPDGRLSSLNFDHDNADSRVHERIHIQSSTAKEGRAFGTSGDGFIKTFTWDNTTVADCQVAIPNGPNTNGGVLQIRWHGSNGWTDWSDLKSGSATTALNYSANGGIDNAIKDAIKTSKDYSDANLKHSAKFDWADSQMSFSVGFNTKLSTVERYLYGSNGAAVQGLNTNGFKYLLLVTVYFSGKIKNSGVLTLEMYEGASSSTANLVCRTTLFLYKDSAGNCTDQQITAFLRYNGSYSGTSNNRYVQFRIDSNGSRDTSVATGFTLAINAKIYA